MSETRRFVMANSQAAIPEAGSTSGGTTPEVQTFFVAHDGDTVFVLGDVPADDQNFQLYLNGQLARLNTDYTLAGNTVTWLNTIVLQAGADGKPGPTDILTAYFYF